MKIVQIMFGRCISNIIFCLKFTVAMSTNQEDNSSHFIAELLVEDKPGALWKVVDTFRVN